MPSDIRTDTQPFLSSYGDYGTFSEYLDITGLWGRQFKTWLGEENRLLYISHALSSWGDRTWMFAVGLYFVFLDNGELRLTSIYGFASGATILIFGAVVGTWVDNTARMKAVKISLFLQNLLVITACIVLVVLLSFDVNDPTYRVQVTLGKVGVVVFSTLANLASDASKICKEKDWVVVISAGDRTRLADLNSMLRRIDLTCLTISPLVAGQIMTFVSLQFSAIFIASWNVVSMFVEYGLLRKLYNKVPALAIKDLPPTRSAGQKSKSKSTGETQSLRSSKESSHSPPTVDSPVEEKGGKQTPDEGSADASGGEAGGSKLLKDMQSIFRGWRIYMKQRVRLAGFSLSFLYMTVLGFDSVSIGYAYAQGGTEALLGGMMGLGAIFGVLGTFIYPLLRKKVGIPRVGLFASVTQILALSTCVLSNWLPGSPFMKQDFGKVENTTEQFHTSTVSNTVLDLQDVTGRPQENPAAGIPASTTNSQLALAFLLTGMITSRFGLWMFDLCVTQILQEQVVETERGVVGGVQNSLNQFMDMIKFTLVIIFPEIPTFGFLIVASFAFTCVGHLLFAAYSYHIRGHILPHFSNQFIQTNSNEMPSSEIHEPACHPIL